MNIEWCLPTISVSLVAYRLAEVLVRRDDRAVDLELDDRQRLAQGREDRRGCCTRHAIQSKHHSLHQIRRLIYGIGQNS
ncbi:hypothetical protein OH818_03805 [Jiella pelagia]|uniref:Secreted protein n=1 Tax=Jiella pelagia TaxID=2986949 RepID=A0ABY7C135_9HYPH|nr:hypothetical protein OH818_03805 [Jiella pelagia]